MKDTFTVNGVEYPKTISLKNIKSYFNQPVDGVCTFESVEKDVPGYVYVTVEGVALGNRRLIPLSLFN